MAIQPTSGATTTTTGATSAAPQGALDKDAFLKLLVAQLTHQDPLSPMQGTEYVTQLAQFSSVEQQIAQSAKLDTISLQLSGLSSNEATALVGKTVTVRGKGIAFDGLMATGASVTLKAPAADVKVEITDANGNVVRTMELGDKPKGALSVSWDGKNDAGITQRAGQYNIKVTAKDADGKDVQTTQDVTGRVVQVTFDKGYPELVLDSGVRCPVSDLVSVAEGPAPTTGGTGSTSSTAKNISTYTQPSIADLLQAGTSPISK